MGNRHTVLSRLGCLMLSTALVMAQVPTRAYAATAVDKSETVHVQTDATGAPTSVTVDELLANDKGAATIRDYSTLEGIVPNDDKQSFTSDDAAQLVWTTHGRQVSYTGTSTDELPVTLKVTYTLDGNQMQPDQLAGATGHLVMRIDYATAPQLTKGASAQGPSVTTPFVCMTVVMLDSDVFSNVQVTNGKVVDDKGGMAVVGIALPGLEESLGLDDTDLDLSLDLPEYLEITADVRDFALDPIYTVVTPELFYDLDSSDMDLGLDDLDEGTDALEEAMTALVDGANGLSGGLCQLAEGSASLSTGTGSLLAALNELPSGIDGLATGARGLAGGLSEVKGGADALSASASQLSEAANGAQETIGAAHGSVREAQETIDELRATTQSYEKALESFEAARPAAEEAGKAATHAFETYEELSQELENGKASAASHIAEAEQRLVLTDGNLDDAGSRLGEASAVLAELISAGNLSEEQLKVLASAQETLAAAQASLSEADGDLDGTTDALFAAEAEVGGLGTASLEGISEDVSTLRDNAQILEGVAIEDITSDDVFGGAETASSALEAALGDVGVANEAVAAVADGAGKLSGGATDLASALVQTTAGATELVGGIESLSSATTQLAQGAQVLDQGANQLTDALSTVSGASQTFANGLSTFNDDGIRELSATLADLGDDAQDLRTRLDDLRAAAQAYDNFAGKAEGQSGSVRFIYKSEQIG